MIEDSIVVAARYCGPPGSANGGYVAGRLAAGLDGAVEVTLRRPPPLDTPFKVTVTADAHELSFDDTLLGSAVATTLELEWVDAPSLAAAADAAGRTFDAGLHQVPNCFVCGPLRDHGDGLRLHVGPLDADDGEWQGLLASPWIPGDDLAGDDGAVRPEFVWAALDCPTAYASCGSGGLLPILLGRQTVKIDALPDADEPCVVVARVDGHERRKHFASAWLFGRDGRRLARGRAVWIEPAGMSAATSAATPG